MKNLGLNGIMKSDYTFSFKHPTRNPCSHPRPLYQIVTAEAGGHCKQIFLCRSVPAGVRGEPLQEE